MKLPLFIFNPDYCRRLFLPYKKQIDRKARSILSVKPEIRGGFSDKSFIVRYTILLEKTNGEKITSTFWGLSSPNPTRLQSFKVMNYLWHNGFSSKNYSISEPIAYFKKHSLVITREIEGESLFDVLNNHSLSKISLSLKTSAKWLKKLHRTPNYILKDVFSSYQKIYWKEQLRVLKMGFPQKSKILEKIIKEIISWEKRNERDKNRKIVHHDFQAKNIILGKGKISVIDFSESRLSKPIIDVFTFLIQLELMNNYFKNPFSLKTIKNFSNIFLKEYFKNQEKDIFKNRIFQKDFNLLKKRIACQSLVGAIISNKKPKILSDILFGKERNYFF